MEENIRIIYEDNHLIAVNKPAGWLVQGDQTGDMPISDWVKNYVKVRYKKPGDVFLGVIHRIDRPVSGVVIFARTSKGLERMNKLFQERKIKKTYWAIVEERPNPIEGKLIHYLEKDSSRNRVHVYTKQRGKSKKSELSYKVIGGLGDHHLLEVLPITGRSHQIRGQLAKIGSSIRGDVKYGANRKNQDNFIHLHCKEMSFIHPVKKEPISIKADLPDEQLWRLFE